MTKFKQPEAMETDDTGLPEEVGGVKVADMPGPEVLNMPGRRDGQTKMVRDGNTVSGKNMTGPHYNFSISRKNNNNKLFLLMK